MHGDREVSTKSLARFLGCKSVQPCSPQNVTRYTGYQVGGCSPFGIRQTLPIYVESTILELPRLFINGGSAAFSLRLPRQHSRSYRPPLSASPSNSNFLPIVIGSQ
jgi:Cys-tRNA(Pro) deacylase